ncbi:MAG: glycosyltransferase family 2 protein [Pseudomonadota bacterium]
MNFDAIIDEGAEPVLAKRHGDSPAVPSPTGAAPNFSLKETKATVTAIVVTYYTGPVLARTIASLKVQPEIAEIIIVDNGNWTDAVVRAAVPGDTKTSADEPRMEIVSGHGNVGFSAACNMGAARAAGDYLLFLNPDAVLPTGGVSQLLADGQNRDHPWLIGAKLVDPDGIEQVGSRRATLTPWRALVETLRLYKLAPRHPYFRRFNMHADPCPGEVVPVPVTSGACFLIGAKDFALVGGFDEKYFLHVEDVDFCLRFGQAGGTVYFNPKVHVTHFKGSSRANRIGIEFHKTRGMQHYFRRHFARVYPPFFLPLVSIFLWLRLSAFCVSHMAKQALCMVGLRQKRGRAGMERARAFVATRSARR